MKFLEERKRRKYKGKESSNNVFTAYIFRENRQVIKREVDAKIKPLFRVFNYTYIIKMECIYLKIVDGLITPVAFYSEGNPCPYNFDALPNIGLTSTELDNVFSGDFHNILIDASKSNKELYILIILIINVILSIATNSIIIPMAMTGG